MKTRIIISVILALLVFSACKKDKDFGPLLQGDFKGNFSFEGDYYGFYFRDIEQDGENLDGEFEVGNARGQFSSSSKLVGDELYIKTTARNADVSLTFVFDGEANDERDKMDGYLDLCIGNDCVAAEAWSARKTSSTKSTSAGNEKSARSNQLDLLLKAVQKNSLE